MSSAEREAYLEANKDKGNKRYVAILPGPRRLLMSAGLISGSSTRLDIDRHQSVGLIKAERLISILNHIIIISISKITPQ